MRKQGGCIHNHGKAPGLAIPLPTPEDLEGFTSAPQNPLPEALAQLPLSSQQDNGLVSDFQPDRAGTPTLAPDTDRIICRSMVETV